MLDKSMDFGNLKYTAGEDVIRKLTEAIMNLRKKAEKRHTYSIWETKDGRYATNVPDATKKEGRRRLIDSTREGLLDQLAEYYFPNEAITSKIRKKRVITLKSLYPKWINDKRLTGRTSNAARLASAWNTFCAENPLSSKLINMPLEHITSDILRNWVFTLHQKYQFTKDQYYNATSPVRQMLEYAETEHYIKETPYKKLLPKKYFNSKPKGPAEQEIFFVDEIDKLWELANDGTHTGIAIRFLLKTGLRRGELIGLKWSDISRDRTHMCINRQYGFDFIFDENGHAIKKVPALIYKTKTKNSQRDVYLVKDARELLNEIDAYNKKHKLGGDFVFRSDYYDDYHLGYEAVEKKLYQICEQMDTFQKSQHKLRKTFISTLLDEGINIDYVRKLVGHEDECTTLKNYCYNRRRPSQTEELLENALAS